jgi:DNA replicative helicase MCM subunit Mcm2 (Cdc46/Mcm family)
MYPIPQPPPSYDALLDSLKDIRTRKGQIEFSEEAMSWYVQWYATTRQRIAEEEKMAGYHERKPDHMIRLGMIIAIAEKSTFIETRHVLQASRILHYLEKEMLYTFKWLGMKPIGQDQERVLRTIKSSGGRITHSELLRKLIYFMNAIQFKNAIDTLKQSNMIGEHATPQEVTYWLVEENQ